MKAIIIFVIGLTTLFTSHSGVAQDRWSGQLRSGVAFPTQELGDADLTTGFGFEATLAYRFIPHLSGYAGWGWHQFSTEQSFAGANVDVEETGYTFGLQFTHPIASSPLAFFVSAGGIYNHLEIENNEGNITADSGHGLGWQAGAGLEISLTDHWYLRPDVRYRALSRDITIGAASTPVDLTYLSVGVGIARWF